MLSSLSRIFLFAVTLFLGFTASFAQSNPAEEKLEKVNSLLEKNNIDAADKKLVKLLEEYPSYGRGWDLLARIRDHQYQEGKKLPDLFSKMTITVKDPDGSDVDSDSLTNSIKNLFSQLEPGKKEYNNYMYTLRQATLYSESAYKSSIYLRMALRDVEVDSALATKELNYYNKAEAEFKAQNYHKAAKYYKRALDVNPKFYKALLYLGDSYYAMGDYIEAIKSFKVCVERYPNLLEPRKYLVDAYFKEGLFEEALQEAINCIMIYPDLSIIQRLEYAAFELNKKPSFAWSARGVFPNVINTDSLILVDTENQPTIPADAYWETYTKAIDDVKPMSTNSGVIKSGNSFSGYAYLEIYGWEKMLAESENEELAVAKEMKENGYLDCYVFLSRFHDDLYPQYADFVKNNRERIINYYNKVVLETM